MAINTGKISTWSLPNKKLQMPTSKNTFVQKTSNIATLPKPKSSTETIAKTNTVKPSGKAEAILLNTNTSRPTQTTSSPTTSSSSGSSYSGGGGVTVPKVEDYTIDLSDILASYVASAEAQKQTIKDTTESQRQILANNLASQLESLRQSEATQRETLNRALERFQEDTAKSRQQQQSNFNANRADLEAQAYLANRQALQSAAARGLGGSGLQQLSQLQNLINQGSETNTLAQSNTDALNALAQALARQEQDTTTSLTNLANTVDQQTRALQTQNTDAINELLLNSENKLNEIDANTASLQNQLKYQEAVRAQNARTQAEQFAANLAAQNASTASNWAMYNQQKQDVDNQVLKGLEAALVSAENNIKAASQSKSGTSKKAIAENNANIQTAYNTSLNDILALYSNSNLNRSYLDSYTNELQNLYNKYYTNMG